MRFQVHSPVENGSIHGVLQQNIINHLPRSVEGKDIEVGIVPIWWTPDFRFKPWDVTHPYCLIDFMEPHSTPELYQEMWRYIYDHPPALWFKRESEGVIGTTLPIEWPVYLPVPATVSRAEFEARAIEVFYNWGYSHPSRPNFHADVFRGMNDGLNVLSAFEQLAVPMAANGHRHWISIHTPHYVRKPIAELMQYQSQAKVAVSLWGNGKKCFRHGEACVGSIMALQEDNLQWAYPWIHGENCIRLNPGNEYFSLRMAFDSLDLYPIYMAGQETARKYYAPDYTRDWIVGSIIKRL